MTHKMLFILGIAVSLVIIISIFGRARKNRAIKIIMLILGDLGCFISHYFFYDQQDISLVILLILYAILNILAIRNIIQKENPRQEEYNAWHDNTDNWKAGIFYYNKNDHRIFVPKRLESLGWTINFANPKSIATFVVLIIAMILLANMLQ